MHYFILFLFSLFFSGSAQAETVEESLNKHIHYQKEGPNYIGHILIDDRTSGINQSTWVYIRNALEYYKENPPIFVILELNTPGGEIYAAQKISDALKELDTQYNIPVVAYINNWAISAGAMLAYSSRYIVTVKDGAMGAAEPILEGEGGKMEPASEKINSAVRADFANRAAFYDRNPFIAEAMVDKDLILVRRNGKIIKIETDAQIEKGDELVSPKGKLLTLTAQEMIQDKVADFVVTPSKLVPVTYDESSVGKWDASKSLLFSAPFFKDIPNAEIISYRMDWQQQLLSWLAHPVVQSALFLGLMMGFYVEFSSPGFGFPGTVGVVCLSLIVLSSLSQELSGFLEIAIMLTGLVLLVLDFFILPTFGLLGFIGLLFFIGGLLGMMLPSLREVSFDVDNQTLNAAGDAFVAQLVRLSATFLIGLGLMGLLARYLPKFKGFDRFVLSGSEQANYRATDNPAELPQPGTYAIVASTLRPSGKIEVEGRIYEAITSGQYIEKGESVRVIRQEGSSLLVENLTTLLTTPFEQDK